MKGGLIAGPRLLFGAIALCLLGVAGVGPAAAQGQASAFDQFGGAYAAEATRCLAGAIADGATDGRRCAATLARPCRLPDRNPALWANEERCLQVLASVWGYETRRHAGRLDRMRQPGTTWSLFALYAQHWRRAEALCDDGERGFGMRLDSSHARQLCTLIARASLAHILEFHPKRLIDLPEEPT